MWYALWICKFPARNLRPDLTSSFRTFRQSIELPGHSDRGAYSCKIPILGWKISKSWPAVHGYRMATTSGPGSLWNNSVTIDRFDLKFETDDHLRRITLYLESHWDCSAITGHLLMAVSDIFVKFSKSLLYPGFGLESGVSFCVRFRDKVREIRCLTSHWWARDLFKLGTFRRHDISATKKPARGISAKYKYRFWMPKAYVL